MLLPFLAALGASRRRYGIMIDAGSSGTRAHLYSWESTTGIPNVQPYPDKDAFMANLQEMAEMSLADGCTKTNPIIPTVPQFAELIEKIYLG